MSNAPVLVDTGLLLALYNATDSLHDACRAQAERLPLGKVFTCWPVITEAAYVLRYDPANHEHLLNEVRKEEFILLSLRAVDLRASKTSAGNNATKTLILQTHHSFTSPPERTSRQSLRQTDVTLASFVFRLGGHFTCFPSRAPSHASKCSLNGATLRARVPLGTAGGTQPTIGR
jgi:hypothetical protein